MLLISYISGDSLDSRQDEVVAKSDLGTTKYFVKDGDVLRVIPDQLVMSRIYPQGIEDPPRPELYLEEHPGEIESVDWSLMEQVKQPH